MSTLVIAGYEGELVTTAWARMDSSIYEWNFPYVQDLLSVSLIARRASTPNFFF